MNPSYPTPSSSYQITYLSVFQPMFTLCTTPFLLETCHAGVNKIPLHILPTIPTSSLNLSSCDFFTSWAGTAHRVTVNHLTSCRFSALLNSIMNVLWAVNDTVCEQSTYYLYFPYFHPCNALSSPAFPNSTNNRLFYLAINYSSLSCQAPLQSVSLCNPSAGCSPQYHQPR